MLSFNIFRSPRPHAFLISSVCIAVCFCGTFLHFFILFIQLLFIVHEQALAIWQSDLYLRAKTSFDS